mmetsp:Transcript_113020/g.319754  ORF Transcript_113020/g.319754 Transcript_113020/m.319754 type:complete len:256 (+) Transcript_113020:2380-3147(+)
MPCSTRLRSGAVSSRPGSCRRHFRRTRIQEAITCSQTPCSLEAVASAVDSGSKRKPRTHGQESRSALAAACLSCGLSNGNARSQKRSSAGSAKSSRFSLRGKPAAAVAPMGAESAGAVVQVPSHKSAAVSASASCFQTRDGPCACNAKSASRSSRRVCLTLSGWRTAKARARRANVCALNSCKSSSSQEAAGPGRRASAQICQAPPARWKFVSHSPENFSSPAWNIVTRCASSAAIAVAFAGTPVGPPSTTQDAS